MTSAPIPLDTLLAHRDWVRAVARAVVRDPNAADDVEQETWLAALRSPPRHTSSLRGWFGAVARSRARRIGRGESRREMREIAASRDEATASAAEIAELADTHRRVVQAVVELDEPYRVTILLRYFEGLSIEDVAARTASPVETTRSRIKRGVAKLRERLSKELGDDERPWAMALAPLIAAPRGSTVAAATKGGVVMASTTTTMTAVVAALALAGLGAVLVPKWTSSDEKTVAVASDEKPAPPPKPSAGKPVAPPPRAPRPRAKEEPAPAPPGEEARPAASSETVYQRLAKAKMTADWKLTPVTDALSEIALRSGVEIVLSAEANELISRHPEDAKIERLSLDQSVGADQMLTLLTDLKGYACVAEEPRIVIVPKGETRDPKKPVVALPPWAPPTPLVVVGRVIDATGATVVGAKIVRIVGEGPEEHVVGSTDVAGRFEIKLTKPFGSLEARAEWQLPSLAVAVDGQPGAQATCELATRGAAGSVRVRVVGDTKPGPIADVVVGTPRDESETLPDGRVGLRRARRAQTNESGIVTIDGVPPGPTPVKITARGFADATRTVEVTTGQCAEIEVALVKQSLETLLSTTRISFSFSGVKPNEVVKFINDAKQLSIVMDPALEKTLGDRAITLSVTDRPVDEALRTFCGQIGAKYQVQGSVIFIVAAKR
jgi:RNA polymerase sigma-70 factor (ECF subfamily)